MIEQEYEQAGKQEEGKKKKMYIIGFLAES